MNMQTPGLTIVDNPAGWPDDLLPLFERALTCEFATLTRAGAPITFPLTPYIGVDERTIRNRLNRAFATLSKLQEVA